MVRVEKHLVDVDREEDIKKVEEKELEARFGEEYTEYRDRMPMFIPRLRKGR